MKILRIKCDNEGEFEKVSCVGLSNNPDIAPNFFVPKTPKHIREM